MNDFVQGKFPVVSSTMALGLGHNWKGIPWVVQVGQGELAKILQIIGRCGHGGIIFLAILFVETSRRNGKNKIYQFDNQTFQSDKYRMDALAITDVCLRVAFSIENQ